MPQTRVKGHSTLSLTLRVTAVRAPESPPTYPPPPIHADVCTWVRGLFTGMASEEGPVLIGVFSKN